MFELMAKRKSCYSLPAVNALKSVLMVALCFSLACQSSIEPRPQDPSSVAATELPPPSADDRSAEMAATVDDIPEPAEIRIPIFANPTPRQLEFLDQPEVTPELVDRLLPGQGWYCFSGMKPGIDRFSACARTLDKCDQHSQFMVSSSQLTVGPCEPRAFAFCKVQSFRNKLSLICADSGEGCRAEGELMVRAGWMHYSKECMGVR